jgi:hypothetical protein
MTLENFLEALEASSTSRRRDDLGDMCISGKAGRIYCLPAAYRLPEGFYLYCDPGSARAWGFVKKALDFCKVAQDGDADGYLFLNRLPTSAEAELIRDKLMIRKRRVLTDEERERLARTSFRAKGTDHAS